MLFIVESEIVIKKSRFIGYGFNIQNEKEVTVFLSKLKKENKKASHFCYAYTLSSESGLIERFNDDGEPSGTAGRPILNILKLRGKQNYAVIVVRYFGGIKLGAGGLTRAYIKIASQVSQ